MTTIAETMKEIVGFQIPEKESTVKVVHLECNVEVEWVVKPTKITVDMIVIMERIMTLKLIVDEESDVEINHPDEVDVEVAMEAEPFQVVNNKTEELIKEDSILKVKMASKVELTHG